MHANTPWKTFIHTCGSIMPLLEDFIETGLTSSIGAVFRDQYGPA